MGTLWWNLRHAFRKLRKSPGFATAAILSLGFGVGANTAIFTLLNVLILQPLAVNEPQQLIRIGPIDARGFIQAIPGPMFERLRKDPLFEGVCGVNTPLSTIEVRETPMPAAAHALSGDCYAVLGVRPAIGRLFTREDDIPSGPRVAVLSHNFWQRQFGGNPNVVGQSIRIEGVPFTVIGVTESSFHGLLLAFPPNVSFPITQEVNPRRADPFAVQAFYWGYAFARVRPGVTPEQVKVRLSVEWRRLLDESLPERIQGAERTEILNEPPAVIPGATGLDFSMRNRFERPLLALLAISVLVLLVSCVNVANLMLARGMQRQREIAVRLTLGASRWQIVRELLTESAVLVVAGLCCAVLLTYGGDRVLLNALGRSYSGFALTASPDVRVMIFTGGVALAALLLFGVFPAHQASRADLGALKSGSSSANRSQARIRRVLVCGQVALTLVLVMGASLFTETLRQLRRESIGFGIEGVLTAQLMPLPGGYAHGFTAATYYRDLLERMQNLPGVKTASLSNFSPLFTRPYLEAIRDGRMADAHAIQAPAQNVSDGFLSVMRISLLEGRDFHRTDAAESQKTGIVSKSLAKRLFPAGDAFGKHIRVGSEKETEDVEIVGVAADARVMDPRSRDLSFVYLNYWQYPKYEGWGNIELRFSGDPATLSSAVRQTFRNAGHEYPINVQTVADQLDSSLLQERLLASLGTAFGILALMLAGVGLFGLLSFLVAIRAREIGIRVALGAERRDVTRLVLREAVLLVGSGLLIGLPLSYATSRLLSGLLHAVGPLAVIPLVLSIALLMSVTGIAAVIPVRRAITVDPMMTLRHE
jgi:predicted permease